MKTLWWLISIVWIIFILLQQKTYLKLAKKYLKKYFCGIVLPTQKNILKFNEHIKSDMMLYISYADIETLV